MIDEGVPLFLQQFDEAGFLGDQGVDAGGFAVDGIGNAISLIFRRQIEWQIANCILTQAIASNPWRFDKEMGLSWIGLKNSMKKTRCVEIRAPNHR